MSFREKVIFPIANLVVGPFKDCLESNWKVSAGIFAIAYPLPLFPLYELQLWIVRCLPFVVLALRILYRGLQTFGKSLRKWRKWDCGHFIYSLDRKHRHMMRILEYVALINTRTRKYNKFRIRRVSRISLLQIIS